MSKADLDVVLRKAVRHFWRTRHAQQRKQGGTTGRKDAGSRGAVTGGAQLDGMVRLIARVVTEAGVSHASIYYAKRR